MDEVSESAIQKAYFEWVKLMRNVDPRYNLIFSTQNGLKLHSIGQAVKAKAMGLTKGVPDVIGMIPAYNNKGVLEAHGFTIEFKSESGTVKLDQKKFLQALADFGYCATVCRSVEEGINQTQIYMKGALNVPIKW